MKYNIFSFLKFFLYFIEVLRVIYILCLKSDMSDTSAEDILKKKYFPCKRTSVGNIYTSILRRSKFLKRKSCLDIKYNKYKIQFTKIQ